MKTRIEKVLKRDDGTRAKIEVWLSAGYLEKSAKYHYEVEFKPPRARNWRPVYDRSGYDYRRLSYEERPAYIQKMSLEHVTEEEIHTAMLELWEQLKPGVLDHD